MKQYIKYACENNADRHSTVFYTPLDKAKAFRPCDECGVPVEGMQDLEGMGSVLYDQITTLEMLSQGEFK